MADRHERGGPARAVAASRWWPDLPVLRGSDLARVLQRLGLDARLGGPDHAIVARGRSAIAIIPLDDDFHPATIRALLRTLGLTPEELRAQLERP